MKRVNVEQRHTAENSAHTIVIIIMISSHAYRKFVSVQCSYIFMFVHFQTERSEDNALGKKKWIKIKSHSI